MKKLIIAIGILSSALAMAAAQTSTVAQTSSASQASILNKGTMQVGGGFSWASTKYKDADRMQTYSVTPQLEYFVMDNLSMGGTLRLLGSSGGNSDSYTGYGLGPSATYYFYQDGNLAFYGAQNFSFTKYSDSSKTFSEGETSVGAKYFFAPQVAFGMGLSYQYALTTDWGFENQTSMTGSFSFYY